MDRTCSLPELGEVDTAAGEFWVENPFMMPKIGKNLSAYERNCLYLNVNGDSFLDASFASNADFDSDSRSAIPMDYNQDGVPDLLVASVGGGPLRLLKNQMPQGKRLLLTLEGTKSNRSAIGARVIVKVGKRQIVRDLFPANGFMGQAPAQLSIGVGNVKKVDEVSIRWPTGKQQIKNDLSTEEQIVISEE